MTDTPKQHDKKLMAYLREADEALYQAWRHSECDSPEMHEINAIQERVHVLIRENKS